MINMVKKKEDMPEWVTVEIKNAKFEKEIQALKTRKKISVTIGPNNVHEILDSLKVNH